MARNSYFNENTLEELLEEIKYVYQSDKRPWVIGYSGGKDSTTVVELVYKMLQMLPKEERNKNVYIVSSDTLIENPLIKIYLSKMNKLLGEAAKKDDLPIISTMVTPPADNSFWANVIGRGFPTPRINGTFRWCTDRLKINPSANYIRNVIKKEGEEVVVLLGVRKAESEARRRRIEGRELANRLMNRHETIPALDLYKLVIALLNPRDPVNLFNLIDSNYVGIQLDIQGLHGLGTEEQVKRLTDVLNQYFTTVMNTTWEKIIMDTRVQPILMLLRSIYEGCQPWYQYSNTDSEQRFYKANYELVLEKIIKTYSVDYLTLNVIEHSMHINVMTKQEELARNIEVETDDIRVICTTVHKAKGLEYGCVIMPYMGMDIASMKKADLDVYVENEKLAYGIRIGDEPNKKYNSNYDVSQEQNERVNEESRVLYVALTRAIRNVVWMKDIKSKSKISWQNLMEV